MPSLKTLFWNFIWTAVAINTILGVRAVYQEVRGKR